MCAVGGEGREAADQRERFVFELVNHKKVIRKEESQMERDSMYAVKPFIFPFVLSFSFLYM